jgi:CubicO group peptidase (beta-lactamase class C family)
MARAFRGLVCIAALFATVAAHGESLDTDAIDGVIDRSMERWNVPAVAVVAIDRGRVVLSRTRGMADVERRRAVTARTLFAVGSITKSFTVVALSRIAERGQMNWDRAANFYLPDLRIRRLGNRRPVSVRDLVTHGSGMHRHDALWYLHAHSRADLVRRLRHLDPFAPPGSEFQYSNLMVAAAGQLAARLAGRSWENLVEREVLRRAGMGSTRLTISAFLAEQDRAAGYFPGDDGRIAIPPRDTTAIAPAASVYSNLEDMTRWLRVFLNEGQIDGKRVVGSRALSEFLEPRIAVAGGAGFTELGPVAYGMGFYLTTYRGERLAHHPGVIDGYAALMSFMPDRDLGVVVLTNLSGSNPVPTILSHSIYDRLLGRGPVSWIDRFPAADKIRVMPEPNPTRPVETDGAPRSLALASYAGTYAHPAYGAIEIEIGRGHALAGRLHGIAFALEHVGGDVWEVPEVRWPLRKGLRMRFHVAPPGRITHLATPLADGPTYAHNPGDLVFNRLPGGRVGPSSESEDINGTESGDVQNQK